MCTALRPLHCASLREGVDFSFFWTSARPRLERETSNVRRNRTVALCRTKIDAHGLWSLCDRLADKSPGVREGISSRPQIRRRCKKRSSASIASVESSDRSLAVERSRPCQGKSPAKHSRVRCKSGARYGNREERRYVSERIELTI